MVSLKGQWLDAREVTRQVLLAYSMVIKILLIELLLFCYGALTHSSLGNFAHIRVLKLIERFCGHCHTIKLFTGHTLR